MKVCKIAILSLLGCLTLAAATGLATSLTSAATVSTTPSLGVIFSDNFDQNDFSDWLVIWNLQSAHPELPCMFGLDPAHWQVKNGMLGMEIDGPTCASAIRSPLLPLTHVTAYELDFDWSMPESTHMDRGIAPIWKDTSNWYDFRILDNRILLQKFVNGQLYMLPSSTAYYNFSAYQTYHFKITVQVNKSISLAINGSLIMEVVDQAPYISEIQSIALEAAVGAISRSISYFDNIQVNTLAIDDGKQLHVPLLKQTDPQWKDKEYDTAHLWADPGKISIQRWGCALTSMAMILKYYGISTLPDGSPLDPASLNAWLISQADGYLTGGYINWVAVTRLTKLVNQVLGTPKLEYSSLSPTITNAMAEILQGRPVILGILGHFLVGDGVPADNSTISIKDPAYIYTLFSQHKTDLLSIRKFTPSHTDLSYIIFSHSLGSVLTVRDSKGQIVTNFDINDDSIIDPSDDSAGHTPAMVHEFLPKPVSDTYTIEINQPTPGPYSLQVLSYDQEANLSNFMQSGYLGNEATQFTLQYHKDSQSQVTPIVTFTQLRHDLKTLYSLKKITSANTYTQIDRNAAYGEQATPDQRSRYITLIQKQLTQFALTLTAEAKTILSADLQAIK